MSDTTTRRRYPKSMENKETPASPLPSEAGLLEKDILNGSLTIDLLMMLKRAYDRGPDGVNLPLLSVRAHEYLMRQLAIVSRPKRTKRNPVQPPMSEKAYSLFMTQTTIVDMAQKTRKRAKVIRQERKEVGGGGWRSRIPYKR
ncbi:hypothetical protein LTR56_000620 [Elasticomyces elasticus]|nr:hypothetical protein LTR56_000620 [Elasticomyces elasticus]KAK3664397.1 hypothetical protein LTR22_004810 [Elasticomyces elasticus]KAK4919399.1 hypothetical protein LTR49_012933 [Elasticomyces elasticus]KAK5758273.1 hypothetical protein LTS12_011596 [Elasticomyces elasticus]